MREGRTMRELGVCKGCGAEIEWAKLNGKPHPFDQDPTKDGTHEICETSEGNVAMYHTKQARGYGQRLVKSHFATCPKAGQFRKGGPSARTEA
jgi:hypothetical protein